MTSRMWLPAGLNHGPVLFTLFLKHRSSQLFSLTVFLANLRLAPAKSPQGRQSLTVHVALVLVAKPVEAAAPALLVAREPYGKSHKASKGQKTRL